MGGCRYRVFLKNWPGPQTGVRLREVSASGGSTVFSFKVEHAQTAVCFMRPNDALDFESAVNFTK